MQIRIKSAIPISLFFWMIMVLPIHHISAQNNDSVVVVNYSVTRNWLKMIDAVDYIPQTEKERFRYMYGSQRATWTSRALLYLNDTLSFYLDDPDPAAASGFSMIRDPYLIQRNFASMQIHDVLSWERKTLVVKDTLIVPTWKILNDIREIAGHICMSASWTDTIKGQHVIAWFALNYPSFAGPERHCGLPGLILGIEINNGALEIMASAIDTIPLTDQLTMPNRFDGRRIRGTEISEEEYRKTVAEYMAIQRENKNFPFFGVRY
jgi:GLPGLI family protein